MSKVNMRHNPVPPLWRGRRIVAGCRLAVAATVQRWCRCSASHVGHGPSPVVMNCHMQTIEQALASVLPAPMWMREKSNSMRWK